MMKRKELIKSLIAYSEDFMGLDEPKGDFEESITALEAFIERRDILVQELGMVSDEDDPELKQQLFELDSQVMIRIKNWMTAIKTELKNLQLQKEAAVKVNRSKSGYAKSAPSSEGYFIDRKK